jgi:hypothetical protein
MASNELDADHYRSQGNNKIQKDFGTASTDTVFNDRYIAGYTFLNVPQMGKEFDDFAISLCDSLLNKNKKGGKNKLAKVFAEVFFPEIEGDKTGEKVLEWLRKNKNWNLVKESVIEYYDYNK